MDLFTLFGTIAVSYENAIEQIGNVSASADTAAGSLDKVSDTSDNASGKTSSFGQKLAAGIGTAAKWGSAIVAGTAAAGTALIGFAQQSASAADTVDKMSQKIGVSREAYQELDFICSQSGTSVNTLQAGMKSLVSAMDGAFSGTASNVEQFEKLGVSVTDADGNLRSSEDVMWEVFDALQSMDNQTEKARLATELFGRSGTELMPLLNGASGSIDEMRQQAHELGLVLDDELIDNGVNLTDSLDQTKRAIQSIVVQLGGSLMPIVEKASDYVQRSIPKIQSFIGRLTPIITGLLDGLLPPLMSLCEQIFPILFDMLEQLLPPITQIVSDLLPIITTLLSMLLPPIVQLVGQLLPVAVHLIQALLPVLDPILALLDPLLQILMLILEPLIELLDVILPPLIELVVFLVNVLLVPFRTELEVIAMVLGKLAGAFEYVIEWIRNFIAAVKPIMEDVGSALSAWIEDASSEVKLFVENLGTFFLMLVEAVSARFARLREIVLLAVNYVRDKFTAAKNNISATFDGIRNAIRDKINSARDFVKNGIDKIKGFFNFQWALPKLKLPHFKISGSFSLDPPSVPTFGIDWYAKGGIMTQPTVFGYDPTTGRMQAGGEAGAEAIAPIDMLLGYVRTAVREENSALEEKLDRIIMLLERYFPALIAAIPEDVVLDSGELVGSLAPGMSDSMGELSEDEKRWRG